MGRIAHRYAYPPIASHPIASHHRTLARRARRHTQHPPASTRRSWHGPTRDTACGIRHRHRASARAAHAHHAPAHSRPPTRTSRTLAAQSPFRISKAASPKPRLQKPPTSPKPRPQSRAEANEKQNKTGKKKPVNSPITHRPRAHRARTPLLHALPVFIPPHHPALAADALPGAISSGERHCGGSSGGGGCGERVERGGGGDTCYF